MKPRTLSLAALLFASLPFSAALAQPAPGSDPKPEPPPPAGDKPQPDKPPADKPPADSGAPKPADARPADAKPVDAKPADAKPAEAKPEGAKEGAAKEGESRETGLEAGRPIQFSANGFNVWPLALLQVQIAPYVGKDSSFLAGDLAERPGFRLRRARFGVGASYEELVEVEVTGEVYTDTKATITLHEAWAGVTPSPYFGASVGIQPVPFSRSALISSADSALIDRPLAVRALAPFHQLGAVVGGSVADRFHYSLGLFNGFERGDQFYAGYEESLAALGNRFSNLAYSARLSASLLTPGPDVPHYGDRGSRLNVGASYFFSDGGARGIHSVEGDVIFQSRGVRLLAEGLYSVAIPSAQPTQPTNQNSQIASFAAVLEAGYVFRRLLGGHIRLEYIDPNTAVEDAADNWLLTVGASFMPPKIGRFAKLQLEFTHREEIHGKSVDNDSLILQTQFALR